MKNFFKKTAVIITITATVFWSMGSTFLTSLPEAQAATVIPSTIGLMNGSFSGAPIKAASNPTAIVKLSVSSSAAGQTLQTVTVAFSTSGGGALATTTLADIAANANSGVALYNDAGGTPNYYDGTDVLVATSTGWIGLTSNIILTPQPAISIGTATSTFYVVIKTSATAANTTHIVATIPESGVVTSNGNGPASNFSANSFMVDTAAPSIISVAGNSGSANLTVTFSEPVQKYGGGYLTASQFTFVDLGDTTTHSTSTATHTVGQPWATITLTGNTDSGDFDGTPSTLAAATNGITDMAGNLMATTPVDLSSPITITTANIPTATTTALYTTGNPLVTFAASGGTTPYTWSEVGSVLTTLGLSLNSSTGKLTTPTAATSSMGNYNVVIKVADSSAPIASTTKSFTINIGNAGGSVPGISAITPSGGAQNTIATTTITGSNTSFSGSSVINVSLPQGVTGTNGITVGAKTVTSVTSLSVPLTIASGATVGARDIMVTTGAQVVFMPNAFTVFASGGSGGLNLNLPADAATNISIPPNFNFTPSANPSISYRLTVKPNSDFSGTTLWDYVFPSFAMTSSSHCSATACNVGYGAGSFRIMTQPTQLSPNTTYYWNVRTYTGEPYLVSDSAVPAETTAARSFTTTASVTDTAPPTIQHQQLFSTPASTAVEVFARVMDNIATASTTPALTSLYYCSSTSCTPGTQVDGLHMGNGYFKYSIPSGAVGAAGAVVRYWLWASDGTNTTWFKNTGDTPFQMTTVGAGSATITGHVYDSVATTTAIAGAMVYAEGTSFNALTAADGSYTLSNLPTGTYRIVAAKTGYADRSMDGIPAGSSNINFFLPTGGGGGFGGDVTKPSVKFTGPPNNGMAPSADSNFKIFVGFSKTMSNTSITTTGNMYVKELNPATGATTDITATKGSWTYYATNPPAGGPQDNNLAVWSFSAGQTFGDNKTIVVIITPNVTDTSGNSIQGNQSDGSYVFSLMTGTTFTGMGGMGGGSFGMGAFMPPYVIGTTPGPGMQNVSINQKLVINFSDAMADDGGAYVLKDYIKLYSLSGSSAPYTENLISSGAYTVALDTSKKIATVTVTANMSVSTRYRLKILGGAKAASGISMSQPGQESSQMFMSEFQTSSTVGGDTGAPSITGLYPISGATGIQVNLNAVNVGFSKDMDASTITTSNFYLSIGSTAVNGTVDYKPSERQAYFLPKNSLNATTTYTVNLTASVLALNGQALTATTTTFTTGGADTNTPTLKFINADDYSIAITYSEPMNSASAIDTLNYSSSVLKPANYTIKQGAVGASESGTDVALTSATITYDGSTNTLIIKGVSLTAGNEVYVLAANVKDSSGNAISGVSGNSGKATVLSSANTKGMLGPMSGGGAGGMMGPSMGTMGMMKAGVFPMNATAGATTIYFVDLPTTKAIASSSQIVLTFPQGFDVSGAKKDTNSPKNSDINGGNTGTVTFAANTEATVSGGANNDGVTVDAVARTVTILLKVTGGTPPASDFLHLDLSGIINSTIPRGFDTGGYSVDMKIMNANGSLSETVSGMPFFINQSGSGSLTVTIAGIQAADVDGVGDTVNVYLGSPMTGPIEAAATIANDGTGSASFSGLTAGQYMIFTDPTLTLDNNDYAGLSMPEPVTIADGANAKTITLTKQAAGGGLKQITVNITGAFGDDDIDVFAGGPTGFKVKTLTDAGTNPTTSLFLGDGNWMVGFGPAMPKGPMAGPVTMPDWMPPMPVEVKISGGGATATESSGTADDGTIAFSLSTADLQIIGYAKDDSGNAIADAEAYAYQPQGGNGMGSHTRTGTDGKFTLKVSATGSYTVGVFKPGLPSVPDKSVVVKADTGNVATDGNATADIYVDSALITTSNLFNFVVKKPGYTISGKLSNGTNAVTYAPVWADKSTGMGHADTMTDSSGNFILYVDNGNWNVNGYIPGYGNAEQQTVTINGASATQNLAPSSGDSSNRYDVSGTITIDGSTQANRPIRAVEYGATGAYLGKQYTGSTNSSGVYSLSLPGTGAADSFKYYRIDIWTPDYGEVGLNYDQVASSLANIKISNAATSTAHITIAASNLITATISLTNKSGYAGKEAYLKIEGTASSSNAWLPTGFNKSLRISDVSGADQTVKLEASKNYQFFLDVPGVGRYMPIENDNTGVASTTHNVIATTTDRMVVFQLASSTAALFTVSGTVRDSSAVALANARVWVGNQNGYNNGTETAADGTYTIKVPTGSTYRMGAMKPGYTAPEPLSLPNTAANTTVTSNFTLTVNSLTISGYIYADADADSTYDAGEAVPNGWVRAETTDGAKVANSSVDGSGFYSLGVTAGTWRLYGMADGYEETQHTSNVTVASSNQTANIKLTANSGWTNTSNLKPIVPANGGTIDDTAASSTGVKLTIPPNALGNSSSNGSVTTALTSAVAKTNSTQPFNDSGRRITATDNSGQAITNLNDYIDMDMVIYKADVTAAVALQATTSLAIYNELKTTDLGYWDATLNDWVKLSTTRTAYYKLTDAATEWTLYVNSAAGDDFGEFIDTLIAGTSYYDYKLVFSSSTNHLTVFAVILPYIATAASAAAPAAVTTTSSGGGGGNLQQSVCSIVLYEDWQTICANGYYYRNVKSQSPSGCVLTAAQENDRKKLCLAAPKTEETATAEETKQTTGTAPSLTQAAKTFAQKFAAIVAEAAELIKSDINSFLGKFGFKRDLAKESVAAKKYVKGLIKDAKGITQEKQNALNTFISYGTQTTVKLGEGERAGVVNSYKSAFGKLPATEAEWKDVIAIANGRWPGVKNTATENNAIAVFKKIYKRAPNRANANDDAAVTVIAYGLRPADRNLNSEKAAIKTFKAIYGYNPVSATAWDIVRAIAYSGAKR